jgi:hypothetical protein
MVMDREMSIIFPRSFTAECYVWLTGGCVIEESRGLGSANGFAPTRGTGHLSRVPERTHLPFYAWSNGTEFVIQAEGKAWLRT